MNRLLRLLCPSKWVPSVWHIAPRELKDQGISAILVDLDNTLVPWRSYDIPSEVKEWLRAVHESGLKVCIVSNTHYSRRLQRLAEDLGVPYVRRIMKPRRGGFREALRLLGCQPAEAVVVGDQIFTDILGGNRMGLRTILVKPLSKREFLGTKLSRAVERILLWVFRRRGLLLENSVNNAPGAGTLT